MGKNFYGMSDKCSPCPIMPLDYTDGYGSQLKPTYLSMKIMGPKDIAAELGVSERHATRLLKDGIIEGFPAGVGEKLWRTTDLDFEAYVVRRKLEQRRKRDAERNPIKRAAEKNSIRRAA